MGKRAGLITISSGSGNREATCPVSAYPMLLTAKISMTKMTFQAEKAVLPGKLTFDERVVALGTTRFAQLCEARRVAWGPDGQAMKVHRCDGHEKASRPMSVGKNQLFRLKVKG
jgi:hypothetical protein